MVNIKEQEEKLQKIEQEIHYQTKRLKEAQYGFVVQNDKQTLKVQEVMCEIHGIYPQFYLEQCYHDNFIHCLCTSTCPHCEKDRFTALQQQKREILIPLLMAKSGIKKRFKGATFDNFETVNRDATINKQICWQYVNKWKTYQESSASITMIGRPGTGKTHLAVAMMKELIQRYQTNVQMIKAMDLDAEIKASWSKGATKTEKQIITDFVKLDLLIIDEVGVQFGTNAEKVNLFKIIGERYDEMKPTIIISNLMEDEITLFIGDRVMDRLRENNGFNLCFDWESYRSKQ